MRKLFAPWDTLLQKFGADCPRTFNTTCSRKPWRLKVRPGGNDLPSSCTIGISARAIHLKPERSEEHTSELQSRQYLVCRLLLEKKKKDRVEPSGKLPAAPPAPQM